MGIVHRTAVGLLPLLPRPLMRRLASRYIAGEELDEALDLLARFEAEGFQGIVDILGEDVEEEAEARRVVEAYAAAARGLDARGLEAYVSVKPTHLGLRLSEDLAFEGYAGIARVCRGSGRFLRVEMEDHTTTDATLRVFERLRAESEDVGLVLQSRLLRTPADIEAISPGPLSVRMVKGIYLEPASIAHVDGQAISDAFVECTRLLLRRGAFVSFATHDEVLAERLLALVAEEGCGKDRYEFQVLLGVREPLWRSWRDAGHPVRVYVPFGPEWRAYSTRRLRKNPEIFRHVVRDFFRLS